MKNNNHYNAFCNICLNDELNLNLNDSYYYDDLLDNGKIVLIKGINFDIKLNQIIDYNPFIIKYIKNI